MALEIFIGSIIPLILIPALEEHFNKLKTYNGRRSYKYQKEPRFKLSPAYSF